MKWLLALAMLLIVCSRSSAPSHPPRVVIGAWEACKQFCAPYKVASACVQGELRLGCDCDVPDTRRYPP